MDERWKTGLIRVLSIYYFMITETFNNTFNCNVRELERKIPVILVYDVDGNNKWRVYGLYIGLYRGSASY